MEIMNEVLSIMNFGVPVEHPNEDVEGYRTL